MRQCKIIILALLVSSFFLQEVSSQQVPGTLSAAPSSVSGFLKNDTEWTTRSAWNETVQKTVWMKISIGDDGIGDPIESDYLEIQLFHIPHALINFVELCRGTQYSCKSNFIA